MLIQLHGQDGIELVAIAQRYEVQLDGVSEWDVSALQILRRRADGR